MFSLTSAKLTGSPGETGWSQVHDFLPEEGDKLAKRGHLFSVIANKKLEEGVERVAAGRELLARLHEEYFGSLEKSPYEAIKDAVQKVVSEFSKSWGEVEIAAISVVGDVVYSAAAGGGRVCLFRNGILATILESTGDLSISASGYPKEKDVIVLGTSLFFSTISLGVLKAALESNEVQKAVEFIAPMVHGKEDVGSLAAVAVAFSQNGALGRIIPEKKKKINLKMPSIKKRASGIFSKAAKFIPERRIYLKNGLDQEEAGQNRKTTFSIGAILLLLLAVSIGFGIRQKRLKDYKASYQPQLAQAESDYHQALSLFSVSPDKARELLIQSRTGVDKIIETGVKDSQVEELINKIKQSRGEILGEHEPGAKLFLDLSLLSSGLTGEQIGASGGNIYVLDIDGRKIVSIGLETKKSEVVAGPEKVEDPISIATYDDRVFVLSPLGVYEVEDEKKKVLEKDWQGEVLIAAYAGNIYLLDKAAGAIYRYAGSSSGLSSKQDWLGVGVKPDFSDASGWAIDGSIYVLFPSSKILKYSLGSPKTFSVRGVYPEITKIDAIFADQKDEFVYLLDKTGKRVVGVDKDGKYKAQYINEKISEATGLVVLEKEKKIILLAADKLYSIDF